MLRQLLDNLGFTSGREVQLAQPLSNLFLPLRHRSLNPLPQPSTFQPSNLPTFQPSNLPTFQPSNLRTFKPSNLRTFKPSNLPTCHLFRPQRHHRIRLRPLRGNP